MNKEDDLDIYYHIINNKWYVSVEDYKKLKNIINEIEKYTKEEIKIWKEKVENDYSNRVNILGYITSMENVLDKIEELKGVDKE